MRGRTMIQASVVALALMSTPASLLGEVTVKDPGTYVVDRAGIIDADYERRLEAWLGELEQKTTAQLKVLTVPTIDGEDIFGFAQRHAELWKLGRSGKDNVARIALALKERKVRIQTGYGLEGALPDSWCGSLSRDIAGTYFKQGAYSDGLFRLAVTTANKIADDANVTLTGMPAYRYQPQRGHAGGRRHGSRVHPGGLICGGGMMPLIVLLIIISSVTRLA